MENRLVGLVVVVLAALGAAGGSPSGTRRTSDAVESVSMIQLIAAPDRYDGRRVVVVGHLRVGFEESAIYFRGEDAEFMDSSNALWLALDDGPTKYRVLNGHVVSVRGRFRAGAQGHLGTFSRGLVDVESLERQLTRDDLRNGVFH